MSEKLARAHVRLSIIAQRLELTQKFYLVFWRRGHQAVAGSWKVYERTVEGKPGQFLADLYVTPDRHEITYAHQCPHLSSPDSLSFELGCHVSAGLKATRWILEPRDLYLT